MPDAVTTAHVPPAQSASVVHTCVPEQVAAHAVDGPVRQQTSEAAQSMEPLHSTVPLGAGHVPPPSRAGKQRLPVNSPDPVNAAQHSALAAQSSGPSQANASSLLPAHVFVQVAVLAALS